MIVVGVVVPISVILFVLIIGLLLMFLRRLGRRRRVERTEVVITS